MRERLPGIVLIVLGSGSLYEAMRITETVRGTATFDLLGPDRYLMIVSALMILCGLLLAITGVRTPERTGGETATRSWQLPDHYKMFLALALMALAMPFAGFEIASLAFFVLAYGWVSRWSLVGTIAGAALSVGALHLVFVRLADVPLPAGTLLTGG